MKKHGILNPAMSELVASMGHTDRLVIADAGLPIPDDDCRIDLALRPGIPSFLETVETVLGELEVQEAVIAEEMAEKSPQLLQNLQALLGDIPISRIPHEEFKEQTWEARGIIRTGECTPYANVMVISGVTF